MTDDTTGATDDGTDASTWNETDDEDDRRDRSGDRSDDRRDRRDDRGGARRDRNGGGWSDAGLYERLQWVALVVLVLVAVATLFSFYTNVTRFIAIWASRKYEPAIQAAFALAVLASSLAGIAALARTLR
ncbi:hypothetical protein G9C85_10815 [Halorubellus sp. JP-L1]|uniref:hypothetical protein n=1 Tax=Halorubellus sp. JP-L1 TaxID=2715753 RepID=UPI00140D6620|nr:hypothetical protein [Halorubellus sp. JP-L1]NHN42116.1 hypothetical protein [Halorubellus sp. JP-L1]